MHRRYGDTFTVNAEPTGYGVVLRNPDDLRTIFRGDPEIFHAGEANSVLAPVVGRRSVLTMDAPEHVVERRRMLPPFHGERIARVAALMESETEREVARWPIGEDFALLPRMQELTLSIIVRVVLGVDEDDRAKAVGAALRRVLAFHLRDMLVWVWPALVRVPPWKSVVSDLDHADELIYAEIERRRADPARAERPDVLSMLLEDDPDPALVRDELVTLLVAGHETTAVALSWTFERLLRHSGALAKVRTGLDDPRDPYRAAVAKEVLRLRPVIMNVARRITAPVELAGHDDAGRHPAAAVDHRHPNRPEDLGSGRRLFPSRTMAVRRPTDLRMDSVRRRGPPLPGRDVRADRNGCRAADCAAAHGFTRRPTAR